jgi:hypothetical protein
MCLASMYAAPSTAPLLSPPALHLSPPPKTRLNAARTASEVYAAVDADAALAALAHRIASAVRAKGVQHARPLLRDWLVGFAANYHR